jgi:hypothetical protein
VVENTLHQRSKSSTFVVARNNSLLLLVLSAAARRRWCGESKPRTPRLEGLSVAAARLRTGEREETTYD